MSGLSELEILSIERACMRLVLDFAEAIDTRNWALLDEIFADDATYARPVEPDIIVSGRENIRKLFDGRPADRITQHLYSNVMIDVLSADRARGSSRVVLIAAPTGSERHPQFGHQAQAMQLVGGYKDEYVRTARGWRIHSRRGYILMHT